MTLNKKELIYIPYFLIALLYLLFQQKYMPEYLDDAWCLSWAHQLVNFNNVSDTVFGYIDNGGTALFGKGYAYVYGGILQIVGWTRINAVYISTSLIWLTAFVWFRIVLKLNYSRKIAHMAAVMILIMEVYFAGANKLRPDSLALFIISMAFYLFISRQYLLAGFLSLAAFEIHPIALTFYFYIIGFLVSIFDDMKKRPGYYIKGALLFIAGALLGVGYYYLLHREYLHLFAESTMSRITGHVYYSYFWDMKFAWRHIPEALIFIVALVLFFKLKIYKKDKFILPFFLACFISTFIIKRGNYHYVAFTYTSVIIFISVIVSEIRKEKIFFILLLLFLLPQYGFLYYTNGDYNQVDYENNLISAIPEDDRMILGNSGAWFALKDRNFHEFGYFKRDGLEAEGLPQSFYLINNQYYRDNIMGYKEANEKIFDGYSIQKISEFREYNGGIVEILLYSIK